MAGLTIIAAYDVSEDDRRSRLAAMLQMHGDRIQKSVFILTVDEPGLTELAQRATALIDTKTDSLWFARQCANCWDSVQTIGQAHSPTKVTHWAVF